VRRTAKSRTCIWRWQERFLEKEFDGLLLDKTRPSRIKPLSAETAERVVALTLEEPPGETTHWTGALMAKATGLSVSSAQRIWRAQRDVVGLYVDPPAHAIVLSIDEKSQIQELDRTQPGLKKGRRNHDARL
jgi:hypothetical protein